MGKSHSLSYEQLRENLLGLSAAVEVLAIEPGTITERVPQTAVHLMMLEPSDWPAKLALSMQLIREKLPMCSEDSELAVLTAKLILNLEKQFHFLIDDYEE